MGAETRAVCYIFGASTDARAVGLPGLILTVSGSNSVVECQLPKLDVVGSSPISRSKQTTYGYESSRFQAPPSKHSVKQPSLQFRVV